jgi:DNA-binding transcriptional MerR regulator
LGFVGKSPDARRTVEQLSIGEFSRATRLSQKALRLYDELGLLPPAFVDPENGYRYYDESQLDEARQISRLRQLDVPLAQISALIAMEPSAAAKALSEFWASAETLHGDRRTLAHFLISQLKGEMPVMYDVTTREIPERTLLCLKRHVDGQPAVWDLGKEFIGYFKEKPLPLLDGKAGAPFLIYYSEVNADSDGPVEMCRPIPRDQAEELAREYPALSLRGEPAHEEAAVHMGKGETTEAQWQLAGASIVEWAAQHQRHFSGLGVRIVYFVEPPRTSESVPDLDFAFPLAN